MNKLEKAVCSIINRQGRWLNLFWDGKQIGSVAVWHRKETKNEFMERYVEAKREGDGTYSLWITIEGTETFFHIDSFEVEQW